MAIKTINFLPSVFRTDTNQKFLNATLDQLVTPPNLQRINGYVGRTNAPTFKSSDNYQPESTALRQNYQLEPSVVVKDTNGNVNFFSSYIDLLQQIKHDGGLIDNQSRLFASESYSFDGLFDFDKLVNFNQYYWLPDGTDAVDVYGANVDTERQFIVTRDPVSGTYNIDGYGTADNPTLKLAHGGVYTFVVDQPGYPFWIQSYPGVSGRRPRQNNLTTRTIVGVENNGTDQGIITFRVPQPTAQDYYTRMRLVATVDGSTDLSYQQLQGQLLSTLTDTLGGIDGLKSQLLNKTIIFTNQDIDDVLWTIPSNVSGINTPIDPALVVPVADRRGVWRINLVDNGLGDYTIDLQTNIAVSTNQKVYVKGGIEHGEFTYYLDPDAQAFLPVPDITAPSAVLYYQDGARSTMVGTMDVVNVNSSTINVDTEIIGKTNYTSPNGVVFTNGLKVIFDTSATPNSYDSKTYYVEGVGTSIKLLPVTDFLTPEDYATNGLQAQDYITIKRSAMNLNGWSRSNRWFHMDVIAATAAYNNVELMLDQTARANRPIIEFDADIQLFNFGRVAKAPIDILYLDPIDAFEDVELQSTYTLDGVVLEDGMRIVFANDFDPNVTNKIYVINIETINSVSAINLVLSDDYEIRPYNNLVVLQGTSQGKEFYYDGADWIESQAKTGINQTPLFDIIDTNGYSISDTSLYPGSDFAGTKLFSYKTGTGNADSVLGFPLSYRNFNQIGDIQFVNNFDTDTFSYTDNTGVALNRGLLRKNNSLTEYTPRNIWVTASEDSKQFQIIESVYDGTTAGIPIDITANTSGQLPYFRVYKNSAELSTSQYALLTIGVRMFVDITNSSPITGDHYDILIYSDTVSDLGYYQVPKNLDFNTENKNFTDLTLGQLRNHLTTIVGNSNRVVGNALGANNVRDVPIKQQGGSIVQHASPVLYSELFLVDKDANFLKGLNLARHEYSNVKNKFLELAATTPGLDLTDAVATTDVLLKKINAVKNRTFPWYYSDMVPYGDTKNVIEYPIVNAEIRGYEITSIFDDYALGNRGVLVYINNVQLVKGLDYTFDTDRAGFTISSAYPLNAGDTLTIVEYENTDGNYIPETPTKLGLYPKFRPSMYLDDTYRGPVMVIQGHDGSITPAFGDFRDDLLLEFEKRIYNNIKADYTANDFDLYNYIPGKFRTQNYSYSEFNRLLTSPFLKWAGSNRVDFTNNNYFDAGDPFTWNYRRFRDSINGDQLTGAWRSIFKYMFDTDRPHQCPWEMLGFSEQPDWWETRYGPAPYTGGNQVLWEEMSRGYIHAGPRAGTDSRFARTALLNFIPVDEFGQLRSPDQFLVRGFNSNDANASYAVGDQGPVETAWRRSSDFPFALQQAIAISQPGYYFGTLMNVTRYYKNVDLNQYVLSDTLGRITSKEINVNGDATSGTVVRAAGYINWIADYLKNQGIDPVAKLTTYFDNVQVQLAYKMAGYSDPTLLEVIAEQSSPTSTNSGVVIPAENYNLALHKSTPVSTIVYSAVIVEKSSRGYTVSGYNQDNPYFTIIPSLANNNAYGIKVNADTGVIYNDFQQYKLTVPYGYEFTNKQQIVDFLISYERYLRAIGIVMTEFDRDYEIQRDFKLSVREFLSWSQQGWKESNILVLSPILNKLSLNVDSGTVDEIVNSPDGSRILDTGFGFIRKNQFTVTRTDNRFTITSNHGQTIALATLNVVEYEHVLIFDNTTVFNDIIYKPELGNRQYRLKLVGSKTGAWRGEMNPPGFIYNNPIIDSWLPGVDYNKGSLVTFKGLYYAALSDLVATPDFVINDWRQVPSDQIKSGMLPNFSYNAQRFNNIFDIDNPEPTMGMEDFSQGMIGFSPRQYMTDFGIDKTTQAKFYQGFIKEKGTINAINAFTAAGFNGVTSTINLYEEWALRTGEYGAIENNQYVELQLDEATFTGDPSTFTLLPNNGVSTDSIIGITPDLLYRNTTSYTPEIYLNRDDTSIYENDIFTAGYVNENDVDTTIYNIGNYRSLNSKLGQVTIGYKIWCALDFNNSWNVYRVYETDSTVIALNYSVDISVEVTTKKPHGLYYSDLIVIKGFDDRFDGFYQIVNINSATSFNVIMTGSTLDQIKSAQRVTGIAAIMRLQSLRLKQPTDLSTIIPAKTWKPNDKLWVDDSGDGAWAVYNKTEPWNGPDSAGSSVMLMANTAVANSGFGSVVSIRSDAKLAAAGMPDVLNGNVAVFVANVTNGNVLTQIANVGTTGLNTRFGSSLDIRGNLIYIGATYAGATRTGPEYGRVYVYSFDGNTTVTQIQRLTSNWSSNTDNKFGQSISASDDNKWLFIGAPGAGNVEVFHANTTNYYTYANTITVGGYANVGFGSIVKTTSDASQTIISAPYATVSGTSAAGAVYVYDRSMEAFTANGRTAFFTQQPITSSTVRVSVNGVEQTSGFTANTTAIAFTNAPIVGMEVVIETNKFQLIEKLSAPSLTSGASFGGAVDISGNDADIYVSSPGYSEPGYHSGLVYRFVNTGDRYGEVLATATLPLVKVGDSFRINGRLITFGANSVGSTVGNILSITANINSANIAGITATTTVYDTITITSNIATSENRLVLTPGNNSNVFANLGITVYTNLQTIRHLGHDDINGFGTQLAVNPSGNTLIVSGPGSTTYNSLTIDNAATLLDQGATTFLDPIPSAGAVYVYGLVQGAMAGGTQDQMAFVQRLQNTQVAAYDQFGSSLASSHTTLLVGAPGTDSSLSLDPNTGDISNISNAGFVYTYHNTAGNVGWDMISQQGSKVDIDSITRMYLFDTISNTILTNLDHIDPAKGKLLGQAEQDIDFWTSYDPAVYNSAGATDYISNDVSVNLDHTWGATQVGKTWWNLDLVRFLDYEQGSLSYRASNWATMFPGSQVQVAEWIVSSELPGQYTGDGTPLYPAGDSAFVSETYVDSATKIIRSRYYYWVINKTSVDTNMTARRNSIVTLEDMIKNPQAQGIPYAAVLRNDTISLHNISNYITGNTTVLHIDYDYVKNDNIIHSEYQLIQEGNANSDIPERIVNKLRDSLAGRDQYNRVVPDATLPIQSNVGIDRGQTIFVDRIAAVKSWVAYVNTVLMTVPVVNDFIIDRLYTAEAQPIAEDYDLSIATHEQLSYIDTNGKLPGYVVLVANDETQQGLWATYTWSGSAFTLTTTQSYYTPFYWSKTDWYDSTYEYTVKPTYQVATIADIQTLTLSAGNTVKVLNNGRGQWEVYRYDAKLTESLVGVQSGTVQLNSNLYDGSPTSQYEIRIIFDTLQNDIFKERLSGKFNEMFFFLINYILTEQKTVDWIFKTSFISIVHQLRKLEQFPNYIRDNQTYYESYINEVKPYRTSLREYLLDYQGSDTYTHDVTDFDLPSTYDAALKKYRSPDLTMDKDITTVSTTAIYKDWYDNYGYGIGSIDVVNAGDTTDIPVITLGLWNAATTVNAGDYVTQPSTGANGQVYINSVDTIITLQNVTGTFTNIIEQLTLSVNANVWVGNTVTQLSTGARGDVYAESTGNVITISNVVGAFDTTVTANTYVYRDGANLTAKITGVSIDNAYIYRNGANLLVNVGDVNSYTLQSGGYYQVPQVTVTGGGGSGANIIAHVDALTNTISRFEVIKPGKGFTSQPTININGTGSGGLAYARLVGEYYIDSLPTIDLTISNNVTVYTGNIIFQPNTVSEGTVYGDVINGNVISLIDTYGTFNTGNLLYLADSNLATSVTSVNSYTQFVDKSYAKIRTFNSNLKFDRVSYTSSIIDWTSNATVAANANVRYAGAAWQARANVYSTATMKLNGNITANVGDYITQANADGNARVITAITAANVITVGNLTGTYYARGGNISINGIASTVRPATVNNIFDYSQYTKIGAGEFDNANDRIMAYYTPGEGMPGRDLHKLVYGVEYPGVQVQGIKFAAFSSNITSNILSYHHNNLSLISSNISVFDFTTTEYATGEYLTVANLDLPTAANLTFKIVNITNDRLQLSEIAGTTFSISHGSNVALRYYDNNDPVNLDSSIQSAYLDTSLGLRAEDINIDGGAYYDTYSSHAPEELIPGQTFEHLDIKVYTKIFSNTQTIAYRIVSNTVSDSSGTDVGYWPKYYKIANTSVLTANLNLTDTSISVANASIFSAPDITFGIPGLIYINGEKIVYWRNYATEAKIAWTANSVVSTGSLITHSGNIYLTLGNVYSATFANIAANITQVSANTLAQIRRGADKTGTPLIHVSGSTVEDIGITSLIPSSGTTDGNVHLGTWLNLNPDTSQRYIITELGEFVTTEANVYIGTTYSSAFLDGSGLENSDTVQAVFLRGS